jgi:hypothetical protein
MNNGLHSLILSYHLDMDWLGGTLDGLPSLFSVLKWGVYVWNKCSKKIAKTPENFKFLVSFLKAIHTNFYEPKNQTNQGSSNNKHYKLLKILIKLTENITNFLSRILKRNILVMTLKLTKDYLKEFKRNISLKIFNACFINF